MPQARAVRTAAALWRALGRAGAAIYPPTALLVFALLAAIDHVGSDARPVDVSDLAFLAVGGAVLASSARFSHPALRLATSAVFLGHEANFAAGIGLDDYASRFGSALFGKALAARCLLFCTAQLASMLVTVAARAAVWAAARNRARDAA